MHYCILSLSLSRPCLRSLALSCILTPSRSCASRFLSLSLFRASSLSRSLAMSRTFVLYCFHTFFRYFVLCTDFPSHCLTIPYCVTACCFSFFRSFSLSFFFFTSISLLPSFFLFLSLFSILLFSHSSLYFLFFFSCSLIFLCFHALKLIEKLIDFLIKLNLPIQLFLPSKKV